MRQNLGGSMLASSIGWILVASGVITAGGGLAALLFPHLFLRLGFEVESPMGSLVFFVRHWGVLLVAVGALIIYSAYATSVRTPVLAAAAVEKFAIGLLSFFRASETDTRDDRYRNRGWRLRHPLRCISCRVVSVTIGRMTLPDVSSAPDQRPDRLRGCADRLQVVPRDGPPPFRGLSAGPSHLQQPN